MFFNQKLQSQLDNYYSNLPKLFKKPLSKNELIAYIGSPALGDTLIGLVTVNNLLRNGYSVDVYSDYAHELRDWFPAMKTMPSLSLNEQRVLEKYSTVLHMHERDISKAIDLWHPNSIVLFHCPLFIFLIHEIEMQTILSKHHLGLSDVVTDNNMQPMPGLISHKYKNRVMIHPTSGHILRNWLPQKFMQLARILKMRGYEPCFVVSKKEREEWISIVNNEFKIPNFNSLSDVAACLYESGYFIGSDSGIGHLASNVGLPTVSIILRKGLAIHWHPFWSINEIVMPPLWLNPRPIREKFWKECTSVKRVLAGFERLAINRLQCKNF